MKNFLSSLILLSLFLSLFSCGFEEKKNDKITVITTCFPLYSFASEILGENGDIELLLKPGQDSHSYEPSAKDIIKIRECDLFLTIGGEDEAWVSTLLKGSDLKNVTYMSLIKTVPPLENGHGKDDGHNHAYDEHIWTSPLNAVKMVNAISNKLCELFPEKEEAIKNNTEAYVLKLCELDTELKEVIKNGSRNIIVFGDRFPFLHLVNDYGINYYSVYSGCSSMTEPSAATVAELIQKVKDEGIPVIFRTPFSNGKLASTMASQSGAKMLTLHPTTNVTKNEMQNGETYISLMKKNIDALKEALV